MGLARIESEADKAITKAVSDGGVVIRSHENGEHLIAVAQGRDGKPAKLATVVSDNGKPVNATVVLDVLDPMVIPELRSNFSNQSCPFSQDQLSQLHQIMAKAAKDGIKVHPESDAVVVPRTQVAEELATAIKECAAR